MTKCLAALAVVLAVVVAACSGSAQTDSTAPPTQAPPPEAVLLSYELEAGTEYNYEVVLDQHLEVAASGDPRSMGGEGFPGEAVVDIAGSATLTHVVAEGPEPGTFEVTITGEFTDLKVTGTVDGEPIDSGDVPEFAPIGPIDVTIVVDEQGNPVGGSADLEDPFRGMFESGPLGGGGLAPGIDPGRFVGPSLPDEKVTVGDTWSDEIETPGLGPEPVVTSVTSTVTGVEVLDGVEVFVIDTTTTTTPIQVDLAEFFAGFLGAFVPEGASEEEAAELQTLMDQLVFLIGLDDGSSQGRTWFDPEAGLARRSETNAAAVITMEMRLPEEATGELVELSMTMSIDQSLGYRLISAPEA